MDLSTTKRVALATFGGAVATVLYVRLATKTEAHVVVKSRDELPGLLAIVAQLVAGRKVKLAAKASSGKEADTVERIRYVVKAFTASATEIKTLSSISNGTSKLMLATIAPHIFLQPLMLALLTHGGFPVSLIGAVHLRSYFYVNNPAAVSLALDGRGATSLVAEAVYIGVVPVTNKAGKPKGIEVYMSLRLVSPTGGVVWEEIVVIFHTTKPGKALLEQHSVSAETLANYFNAPSFENLSDGKGLAIGAVSGDATWNYGVLSKDVNPIHMSGVGARLLGHKGRIAHGILAVAMAINALPAPEKITPAAFAVAFKGPISCDSEVVGTTSGDGMIPALDITCKGSSRPSVVVRPMKADRGSKL